MSVSSEKKFRSTETAWCPGCGNFSILRTLVDVLNRSDLTPQNVLLVGGIGQAAKTNQYITANGFSGLHGRSLPAALGLKIANPEMTVIVNTGDGDSYGEGGNHLIHTMRRNVDITHFVHDNQIYGLTTGQTSPTSDPCDWDPEGRSRGACNAITPLRPLHLALATGATFVARSFSGNPEHLAGVMKAAIAHNGYAIVDILQPCVTFNRINTFQWYNERVKPLEHHDTSDLDEAIRLSTQWGDEIPIGIFYQKNKPTFHQTHPVLATGIVPAQQKETPEVIADLLDTFV